MGGGVISTMGISYFNLRRSQKGGKTGFNQPLIHTHTPFPPIIPQFFNCPSSTERPET